MIKGGVMGIALGLAGRRGLLVFVAGLGDPPLVDEFPGSRLEIRCARHSTLHDEWSVGRAYTI